MISEAITTAKLDQPPQAVAPMNETVFLENSQKPAFDDSMVIELRNFRGVADTVAVHNWWANLNMSLTAFGRDFAERDLIDLAQAGIRAALATQKANITKANLEAIGLYRELKPMITDRTARVEWLQKQIARLEPHSEIPTVHSSLVALEALLNKLAQSPAEPKNQML